MEDLALLLPAGFVAGLVSTVAGMGGGMLLVLALSLALGPLRALAVTTPALLAGNVHRVWMFRRHVDRRIGGAFVLGAFPAALVAGLLTAHMDPRWIGWIMLAVSLFAVARALGVIRWTPKGRALTPAGALAGGVAAAAGSGILVPPILLAAGLRGPAFVATASATAVAIHVARLLGYGAGGLFSLEALGHGGVIAAGILLGNLAGARVRERIGNEKAQRVTYGALGLIVLLALLGLT